VGGGGGLSDAYAFSYLSAAWFQNVPRTLLIESAALQILCVAFARLQDREGWQEPQRHQQHLLWMPPQQSAARTAAAADDRHNSNCSTTETWEQGHCIRMYLPRIQTARYIEILHPSLFRFVVDPEPQAQRAASHPKNNDESKGINQSINQRMKLINQSDLTLFCR
jgi:hypothetical protein